MSKDRKFDDARLPGVQTGWTDILMICRKCSRKLGGGFGPDGTDTLKRAMRAQCRRERIGLVEVPCLGICPKRAVTTLQASRPGVMTIVQKGKEAVLF